MSTFTFWSCILGRERVVVHSSFSSAASDCAYSGSRPPSTAATGLSTRSVRWRITRAGAHLGPVRLRDTECLICRFRFRSASSSTVRLTMHQGVRK